MRTEEEVESWYEEEKKKSLEKFLAVLEKREDREKIEQKYAKDLNTLFAKYKKLKLEIIKSQSDKAIDAAAKKAKAKSFLEKLLARLTAKLIAVLRLIKR